MIKSKSTASTFDLVNVFIQTDGNGQINESDTMELFLNSLNEKANQYNTVINLIDKNIESILNEDCNEFMNSNKLKYELFKIIQDNNAVFSLEEMDHLIEYYCSTKFIYARKGRTGGFQMFENAVRIIARADCGNNEINDSYIDMIRNRMMRE